MNTLDNTFFTSDQHYFHKNIMKYCNRPFQDVDEMNEYLIYQHNSVVKKTDTVFFMGDFGFSSDENLKDILKRLNGNKFLVYGNHDKSIKKSRDLQMMFGWCRDYFELHIPVSNSEQQMFVLHHYPHITWNKSHRGSIAVHGHCHHSLTYPFKARIIDAGVDGKDYNYAPISARYVYEKLKDVKPDFPDHHSD